MSVRLLGALLILGGCGGFGISLAAANCREERELERLLRLLREMESQLQYRLTPLPELCSQGGRNVGGTVGEIFVNLARELHWQSAPDAAGCMKAALRRSRAVSPNLRRILTLFGGSLGRFDLPGQLRGLEEAREGCNLRLAALRENRESRLRGYRTLGLCAGAALAILLL